jgi:hypothetical protein
VADLSDITAALATLAASAVYPNGVPSPSVTAKDCRIFEGWPIAEQLDADVGAGISNVSIFPSAGSSAASVQVFEPEIVVAPAVHGLTASIAGNVISLAGTPSAGEYVTVIADGAHIYSRVGASASAICAALKADAVADYPSASNSGATLTIPAGELNVRIGSPCTMGKLLHRQKQMIMVSIWAPNHSDRAKLSGAIDIVMKQNLRLILSDGSQAIMTYDRTHEFNSYELLTVYRRDLVYSVEYGTMETFTAYEVTAASIAGGPSIPDQFTGINAIS